MCKRPPGKIFARIPKEVSWQYLWIRSLISNRCLLATYLDNRSPYRSLGNNGSRRTPGNNRSVCNVSPQGLHKRCPSKTSVGGVLCKNSMDFRAISQLVYFCEIFVQALCRSSLHRLCSLGKIMQETFWEDLRNRSCAMSLQKVSIRGVLGRSLYKVCARLETLRENSEPFVFERYQRIPPQRLCTRFMFMTFLYGTLDVRDLL